MLTLESITIGKLLRRTAATFSSNVAIEYIGEKWTYSELDADVDKFAKRLLGAGVQRGDHIAIWCEAEPNTIILMYAALRIGAVTAMINTSLERCELISILESSDIKFLFIGDGYKRLNYLELCSGIKEQIITLEEIFYIGMAGCSGYDTYKVLLNLPEVDEAVFREVEDSILPEDSAFMLYTSGTTSKPKAVLGSHYSRANSGIQQANDLGADCRDRFCVAMPVFHCFCISVNIIAACAVGACLYIPKSRHTEDLLHAISEGHCTILSSVPAMFHAMLLHMEEDIYDLSSLRTGFIGGSICSEKLFKEINDRLGFTLLSSLGQTEATAGITSSYLTDSIEIRANTLGHFMDHIAGKIVDPNTGYNLPIGANGEICIHGYSVMQGYYKQPEATAAAIDKDGWLHTGDMGYLDSDSNVHLTGRLKELIIRGGENISPAEIESVLQFDDKIEACKAIGVPDEHYGEAVCLCVILKKGALYTDIEIKDKVKNRLAEFKVPEHILFMDSFPYTSTGKLNLSALKRSVADILKVNQETYGE